MSVYYSYDAGTKYIDGLYERVQRHVSLKAYLTLRELGTTIFPEAPGNYDDSNVKFNPWYNESDD